MSIWKLFLITLLSSVSTLAGARAGNVVEDYDSSGMQKVVLEKNIQMVPLQRRKGRTNTQKNVLSQKMLDKPNTIYVIQYNYELNDEKIEIPDNCILEFDGGCIDHGTLVGKNTGINAGLYTIFGEDVTICGSWNIEHLNVCWFGLRSNDSSIDFGTTFTNIISKTQNITQNTYWSQDYYYGGIIYKLGQGVYYNKSTVSFKHGNMLSNWTLDGYAKGSTIIINQNSKQPVFYLLDSEKESRRNWTIRNVVFRDNDAIHIFQPASTILENCYFLGCRNAIQYEMTVNTIIKNCTFLSCQQGIRYTGSEGMGPSTTYYIEHCAFNHCGKAINATVKNKNNSIYLDVRDSYIEYSTGYGFYLSSNKDDENAIVVNFSNCFFEGNSDYLQYGARTSFVNCYKDYPTDEAFKVAQNSFGYGSFSWLGSITPKVEGPLSSINLFISEHRAGTKNERPSSLGFSNVGFQYFDTTLGKPIYWTGTKWVDALGNPVEINE